MSQSRFVFFRYPQAERRMIIEDSAGPDTFLFADFLQKHPVRIQGNLQAYDAECVVSSTSHDPHLTEIDQLEYERQFDHYLQAFRERKIRKAILSRVIKVSLKTADLHTIFQHLCDAYPSAMIYVANLGKYGVWAGASPERLLHYENNIGKTVALAGTKKSAESKDWGLKEHEEHREVENYIEQVCADKSCRIISKSPVYIAQAGKVFHLKSDFTIELKSEKIDAFLSALHPTPAVCGTPLLASKELILETESHGRAFYTGYVGLAPSGLSKGQAFEFYVNLRCMRLVDSNAYLFVGGGITSDSLCGSEWEETIDKSKTLLSILGE